MSELSQRLDTLRWYVDEYEGGRMDFATLQSWTAPITPNFGQMNPLLFAVSVYEVLRPREAVAYQHRTRPLEQTNPIYQWVQEGFTLHGEVRRQQESLSRINTNSDLEEAGKLFIEDKLSWAEGVLTRSLPSWGFTQSDSS